MADRYNKAVYSTISTLNTSLRSSYFHIYCSYIKTIHIIYKVRLSKQSLNITSEMSEKKKEWSISLQAKQKWAIVACYNTHIIRIGWWINELFNFSASKRWCFLPVHMIFFSKEDRNLLRDHMPLTARISSNEEEAADGLTLHFNALLLILWGVKY